MKIWIATLGTTLLIAGCQEESAPAPSKPIASTETKATALPMMTEGCPDKDATHVCIEDAPVFTSIPGQGVNPVGTLKSGCKVLAMVPGPMYTKCTIGGGKTVYIKTASLKPTTN
jgi:ABC-type Fe3+-hydroxamate transport system substrate-binding protein